MVPGGDWGAAVGNLDGSAVATEGMVKVPEGTRPPLQDKRKQTCNIWCIYF